MEKILIAGMSRSGTDFIHVAIYSAFGKLDLYHKMKTARENGNDLLSLHEPSALNTHSSNPESIDRSMFIRRRHDHRYVRLEQILEDQKEFFIHREEGPLVVIKNPNLDGLDINFLSEFDQVLVCSRKPESWLLSAMEHTSAKGQIDIFCDKNQCSPLDYAQYRYAQAEEMVASSKKAVMLDFHDVEGRIEKLSKCLGHPDDKIVRGVFDKHWTGSRYEK